MLSLKQRISKNIINALGWSTNRKLILIESDDWGAIRMPSLNVYKNLLMAGIEVDKSHFDKHDSLESDEDLTELFSVLLKYTDKQGNHPVFTSYYVVANPDFEKIEQYGRQEYHYETILDTYKRFGHTRRVPELVEEGIEKDIFIPQFHGREHIHVKRWMEAINSSSIKEQLSFDSRAIISSGNPYDQYKYPRNYFASLDYSSEYEFDTLEEIHEDGLKIFKNIFGFDSISFTPQGGFWGDHINRCLSNNGVKMIPGRQYYPVPGEKYKIVHYKWGRVNEYGQVNWRRNCLFEPARDQDYNWVGKAMAEINIAFKWGKPAVISTHRENYIGSIFEDNRRNSLMKLDELIRIILLRWPDVEFISTNELYNHMGKTAN